MKKKKSTKKNLGGRPVTYNEQLLKKAIDYLSNYESKHEHPFPSVVGLCSVIKRARSTLYKWCEEGDKKAFKDVIDSINEIQEMVLLHKGIVGEFNSNITKLVLAKHGYHDKQETEMYGKDGGFIKSESKTLLVVGIEPANKNT